MVKMVCQACRYELDVPKSQVEFGMVCPECHGRQLKRKVKRRRQAGLNLRPQTVRLFVGGFLGMLVGPVCVAAGYNRLAGREGIVWARVFAIGIVILIAAVISLIAGTVSVYHDLRD